MLGQLKAWFFMLVSASMSVEAFKNTMGDCAATCKDTSMGVAADYFAQLSPDATTCAAIMGLCDAVNRLGDLSNAIYMTDHDGTQAPEKYSVDLSQSGLSPKILSAIAQSPQQQSQNSIISGVMMPILLSLGNDLGVYNTESAETNAANFAKRNAECESATFSSSWQKFFECIGGRVAGMSTDELMATRYASFETFESLGWYYSSAMAFEHYLYDLGIAGYVQTGGTAWEYIAQATIYPQSYNAVFRSETCDPVERDSDEMLAQASDGCPCISDTVKTTKNPKGVVTAVPNTFPICGFEAYEAPESCVTDGIGKGLNLQFNCETYGLCNSFFFGNSNGDFYPANYTLSLAAEGVLPYSAVFIHNNPSICQKLRVIYNQSFDGHVPCYDIVDPAAEIAPSFNVTEEEIVKLQKNYDKWRARDNEDTTESVWSSRWAFMMYGAMSAIAGVGIVKAAQKAYRGMQGSELGLFSCRGAAHPMVDETLTHRLMA